MLIQVSNIYQIICPSYVQFLDPHLKHICRFIQPLQSSRSCVNMVFASITLPFQQIGATQPWPNLNNLMCQIQGGLMVSLLFLRRRL